MKKQIITILLFTGYYLVQAQSVTEIIKNASDLMDKHKYESAFVYLERGDTSNANPDIFLMKLQLALNNSSSNSGLLLFSFTDDTSSAVNESPVITGQHIFYVLEIADNLLTQNPDNCNLYKGLSAYYNEAYQRYGNSWRMPPADILKMTDSLTDKVINLGCSDFSTYYIKGFTKLAQANTNEALTYLRKSNLIQPDVAEVNYYLAVAHLYLNDLDSSLLLANLAYKQYSDAVGKANASRLAAEDYYQMKKDSDAVFFYERSNVLQPNNYYTLQPLLELYVKRDNPAEGKLLDKFYHLNPSAIDIYRDLNSIYLNNQKETKLIKYYEKQLTQYADSTVISGNILFFSGELLMKSNPKAAQDYLKRAATKFHEIYADDNPVFEAIRSLEQQMEDSGKE